ncbi:dephospho-CoA kinase [Metabacillus litoralis]|uniref:Dephospho-CoA kinase n=1 Tax=Metabacillus litoralis TaxID=152268 RepID=A0A5C6W2W5_9BACI|nr:dephospho-CoA kinase [Metabacillus litoralis]TXC90180.1 dephospho-CoA kinase [Metabacillus litoralis]
MTIVIGLTGGIASGKSTISSMLQEKGIRVVDADHIARVVVEVGEPAYNQIVEEFGIEILKEDKTINREKLGTIIFSDENKRQTLNSIVHPAVRKEMLKQVEEEKNKQSNAVVLDIPLLFESKLTHIVDKTLLVYVDQETQMKRLMKRNGYNEEEAKMRMDSQLPLYEKRELSDYIIDNNGSIESTKKQLNDLLEKIL